MATAAVKKKKTAKSSKPKKKVGEKRLRALMDQAQAELAISAKERYKQATKWYEAQDDSTQEAIDRIHEQLKKQARKRIYVRERGETLAEEMPEKVIEHNTFYMAVEIVKDLAVMDIRVASFKFAKLCAECGTELKSKKKGKKK